jgi:hypothetical protein
VKFSKDVITAVKKMPTGTEISKISNHPLFDGEHTGPGNYNPDDTVTWDPFLTFCKWTSSGQIIACPTRSSKSDSIEFGMSLVHPVQLMGGEENE